MNANPMSLSQEAIEKILDIKERTQLTPQEMADTLNVTFFPIIPEGTSDNVKNFADQLRKEFISLKVNVVPYEQALGSIAYGKFIKRYAALTFAICLIPFKRIFAKERSDSVPYAGILWRMRFGKKIKKGISVIALGEGKPGKLPIDYTNNLRDASIVTILDMPPGISEESDFFTHFNAAIALFARHMTNVVIGVGGEQWVLYNFNASHPFFPIHKNFRENILHALVPKLAAPIKPPRFSDFVVRQENFDPCDATHHSAVEDLVESGSLFEKSGLYPHGKKVNELPFKNAFYRWIGGVHLDHRTGMSYGFVARQLPVVLPALIPYEDALKQFGNFLSPDKDFFTVKDDLYIILELLLGKYVLKIPDVWVLTQRSGADKTNVNPSQDLIKMGLQNGTMILETPKGLHFKEGYRPSFDTKVILAHAVGNAIVGSVLKHLYSERQPFVHQLEHFGLSINHWHGYMNEALIPQGWYMHGLDRPPVSCSSPQSAIYALDGKLTIFMENLAQREDYMGDIHIEPHHGTNIIFPSLKELGEFLNMHPGVAALGNKYLHPHNP